MRARGQTSGAESHGPLVHWRNNEEHPWFKRVGFENTPLSSEP